MMIAEVGPLRLDERRQRFSQSVVTFAFRCRSNPPAREPARPRARATQRRDKTGNTSKADIEKVWECSRHNNLPQSIEPQRHRVTATGGLLCHLRITSQRCKVRSSNARDSDPAGQDARGVVDTADDEDVQS